MDPHFSHKTPAVPERVRPCNVPPLRVPAGRTDVVQECDTVTSRPPRAGVKSAFRDSLRQSPSQFREENPDRPSHEWAPELKVSDLGPLVVRFVEAGLSALDTPDVTETVKRAPQNDGKLAKVRGPETQLRVKTTLATEMLEGLSVDVPVEVGEEAQNDDDEPAVPLVDDDDSSDDDDDSSDDDDDSSTASSTAS